MHRFVEGDGRCKIPKLEPFGGCLAKDMRTLYVLCPILGSGTCQGVLFVNHKMLCQILQMRQKY